MTTQPYVFFISKQTALDMDGKAFISTIRLLAIILPSIESPCEEHDLNYLIILLCLLLPCAAVSDTLIFSVFDHNPPKNINSRPIYAAISSALASHGHTMKVIYQPLKRAITSASNGDVDGVIFLPSSLSNSFKSLVLVDYPLATVSFYLFSMNKELGAEAFDCKKIIGLYSGHEVILQSTPFMETCTEKVKPRIVNHPVQLAKMLQAGRLDYLFAPKAVLPHIESKVSRNIRPENWSRFDLEVFIYLHESNKTLARPLAASLKIALQGLDDQ